MSVLSHSWASSALSGSDLAQAMINTFYIHLQVLREVSTTEELDALERKQLIALANLEAGHIEQIFSYPAKAADFLAAAQEAAGITAELTGQSQDLPCLAFNAPLKTFSKSLIQCEDMSPVAMALC